MKQSYVEQLKNTIALRLWSFWNVPMIYAIKPWATELSTNKAVLTVKLRRKTKNHLQSLYMGVLVAGADLACGLLTMHLIKESKQRISLVFKDIKADFLKRAESHTIFVCDDGAIINNMIEKAINTNERVNSTVGVTAYCPEKLGDEPVAKFKLTLSIRKKR